MGKRVAFIYKADRARKDSKVHIEACALLRSSGTVSPLPRGEQIRVIWGKVTIPHGNTGVVRAKFTKNLPPKSIGASVRVVCRPRFMPSPVLLFLASSCHLGNVRTLPHPSNRWILGHRCCTRPAYNRGV